MKENGYSNADHYCYFGRTNKNFIILLLYVDNMLVVGSDLNEIIKLKKQLSSKFTRMTSERPKRYLAWALAEIGRMTF